MRDRKYRILYLPDNQSEMRELRLSRNRMIFFAAALVAILFAMMTGTGILMSTYYGDEKLSELDAENMILKNQLELMSDRMAGIANQVDMLRKKDSELRLVTNLPDVEEVLRDAGIGGSDFKFSYNPDLLSSASDELVRTNLINLEKLESSVRLELQSYAELSGKIGAHLNHLNALPSISPIKKGRVTDRFGVRRSFRSWKPHTGLDIAARWGTPVYATADGRVEAATWRGGYGKSIIVDHGNGIKTLYGHLSSYSVRNGQRVKRNQKIAEVGSTGLSTAPHLHYEIRVYDVVQNPELYIFFDMVNYLEVK